MQAKSFNWYVNTKPLPATPDIESALSKHCFEPCGSQQVSSQGWVRPLLQEGLVYEAHGAQLLMLKQEKRLLPASVVNDYLQEKLEAFEAEEGYMPSRKVRLQMKEDLTLELLPKAFTKASTTPILILPRQGWLLVMTGSAKAAEDATAFLRESLGSLPIALMNPDISPAHNMTLWLTAPAELPEEWSLGEEAELRDADGALAKVQNQDLFSDELSVHTDAGKIVSKLQLIWREDVSIILQDDLSVKRIKLLLETDDADGVGEGQDAKFAHEFAVTCNWIVPFCHSLLKAFGGLDKALAASQEKAMNSEAA